ncbi:MAG: transcriptional repressor LexA [Clostridiales bacterium]|nr:transcriptional repressor LexA [Clostridiales bacterium]MCD7801457.1 transcriptional repressor LexA [Clostridiales bacterium]
MKELTPKQQRIYDYILDFTADNGYPPSVREIAAAVGLKSPSTVHFHLKALEEAGAIVRGSGKTRAITPAEEPTGRVNQVPLLGSVAAGSPILAEECIEDYLVFDTDGLSGEHFALRIRGESMLKAGILPGDIVIVHQQENARNGEIVIALIGDEATCKRLDRRNGETWLLPENDDYQPIDGSEATILGKVVAVVRRY